MSSTEQALTSLCQGGTVVLDAHRQQNRGFLIAAAESVTSSTIAWMLRHGAGPLTAIIPEHRLHRLQIPPLPGASSTGLRTAVRLAGRTESSASARAAVVRALADPGTASTELTTPGYVTPLGTEGCGVLRRPCGPEAALDMLRIAGLNAAAIAIEVSNDELTDLASEVELRWFAERTSTPLVTTADVAEHRWTHEHIVRPSQQTRMPLPAGDFQCQAWTSSSDGAVHVTFTHGTPATVPDPIVHIHVECPVGDILRAQDCGCRDRLDSAMSQIASHGHGVLVYLRGGHQRGSLARHLLKHDAHPSRIAYSDQVTAQILAGLGLAPHRFPSAA